MDQNHIDIIKHRENEIAVPQAECSSSFMSPRMSSTDFENVIVKSEPFDEDVLPSVMPHFCETEKLVFERVVIKNEKSDEPKKSFVAESFSNSLDDLDAKGKGSFLGQHLGSDSLKNATEERGLVHGSIWTADCQRNLENQPLECTVVPVKEENKDESFHDGSENMSLENHKKDSLVGYSKGTKMDLFHAQESKSTSLTFNPETFQEEELDVNKFGPDVNILVKQITYHKCTISSKTFTSKQPLIRHEQTQSGAKPYKCTICSKTLTTKAHLNVHERIHSGVKPYECTICSKAFITKAYLDLHELNHSGVKPYNCEICSKAFTRKAYLNLHEQIHTGVKPYKCEICSKACSRKADLNLHERIHTGVKPYKCEICSKAFMSKSHLNRHAQFHSGVKPFKCEICSKSFTLKQHLNRHKLTHLSC